MTRSTLFAAVSAIFLVAVGIYVAATRLTRVPLATDDPPATLETDAVIAPPFIMFRALAPREAYGRVSMVPLAAPGLTRYVSDLSCARVHYFAGTGVCMTEEADGTNIRHVAALFDRQFGRGHRIALSGLPIRTRISPDGRLVAITVYGEEHLPSGEERLATETILVDAAGGSVIANLKEFAIESSGKRLEGPLDFSSVAFTSQGEHFFATLSTDTERHLVVGSLSNRRLTIVGEGFANEGLSPDGNRLLIKKRIGERGHWQLLMLDLPTNAQRELNQGPRSIDDQVEWLDDEHVIYHDATAEGTGIWALKTDGVSPPRLLIRDAYSPSVVSR